jgi:hypothetical protein
MYRIKKLKKRPSSNKGLYIHTYIDIVRSLIQFNIYGDMFMPNSTYVIIILLTLEEV